MCFLYVKTYLALFLFREKEISQEKEKTMEFQLKAYTPPDFTGERFRTAPDAVLLPAPKDGVVPEH